MDRTQVQETILRSNDLTSDLRMTMFKILPKKQKGPNWLHSILSKSKMSQYVTPHQERCPFLSAKWFDTTHTPQRPGIHEVSLCPPAPRLPAVAFLPLLTAHHPFPRKGVNVDQLLSVRRKNSGISSPHRASQMKKHGGAGRVHRNAGAESTEVHPDRKAGLVSCVHSLIAHSQLLQAAHDDEKRNRRRMACLSHPQPPVVCHSGTETQKGKEDRSKTRGYKGRARLPQERLALSEGIQPAGPILIDNSPEH